MVVIIDSGMGNLRSIQFKLEKEGVEAVVASDPGMVARATKLILPGVGFFAAAMNNLHDMGLLDVLNEKVLEEKTPIMGICLGMQLLTNHSEEGDARGLGWIDANTVRFEFEPGSKLRVPHVGWNLINATREINFLGSVSDGQRFYFTHSYFVRSNNEDDVVASTPYGRDFVSIVQRGNIFGTQFHPEKSHRRGFEIIKDFVRLS